METNGCGLLLMPFNGYCHLQYMQEMEHPALGGPTNTLSDWFDLFQIH